MNRKNELALIAGLPAMVEKVVNEALELINDPIHKGGYFCLSRPNGQILLVTLIGEIDPSQMMNGYCTLCQDNAVRLAHHATHISSFQNCDGSNRQSDGAILTDDYILSFSGLGAHWNEACMLRVVDLYQDPIISMHVDRFRKIVQASGNQGIVERLCGYKV